MESRKATLLVAGAVVVIAVLLALVYDGPKRTENNQNTGQNQGNNTPPPQTQGAQLALNPSAISTAAGQNFTVTVELDTKTLAIEGVDIYSLRFDPTVLQVVDNNSSQSGVQITAGSLMPTTVVNRVDNSKGTVQFSQITQGGSKYTGKGTLATITFRALKSGNASLKFDHESGKTSDTNVASGGTDKLTSVVEATVTVR